VAPPINGIANSFHVWGQAIDYNQGDTEANYNIALTASTMSGVAENLLYGVNDDQEETPFNFTYLQSLWPVMPEGINAYTHGHVSWNN
jgi:hypothetical protein